MNVLVYSGPGTTAESVKHCLETLRFHLSSHYAVVPVSETVLLKEPWMRKTAMFVLPGGADLPYCETLNGEGNARLTKYVRSGGKFMGFCAGAYYASSRCEFDVGGPLEVSGSRELKFYPGVARGCAFKGFEYNLQAGARAARLAVNSSLLPGAPSTVYNYYNGGCVFANASLVNDVEVLATYDENIDIPDDDGSKAAIIYRKVGKGDVILAGSHPEYTPDAFSSDNGDEKLDKLVATLKESDHVRKLLMRQLLKKIGLSVPDDIDSKTPALTPIFITSPYENKVEDMEKHIVQSLEILNGYLQDINDLFLFQEYPGQDQTDEVVVVEDASNRPKVLEFCKSGTFPAPETTPNFDIKTYFETLTYLGGGVNTVFGGVLGYAEVITSTNTILEKNQQFLESLPHGFAITAATQIAGRGRGGNVWINPRGVMATSVLFRVPQSQQRLIITLQYLCGLALIEAILGYGSNVSGKGIGYEDLPVRIKWPNDIFILKPEYIDSLQHQVSTTLDGEDEKYVKISGALVNSQYINGQYNLVWGCGVNVSNPAPTTSLNLVLEKINKVRQQQGKSALPPYEPEKLLAKLMYTIDSFYRVFEKSGLEPFLPLYYKRWFHLNQKVDVDGANGRRSCIVRGITSDYGMLVAEDVQTKETLHLQPDGNSFDIFKGLIYKKNT